MPQQSHRHSPSLMLGMIAAAVVMVLALWVHQPTPASASMTPFCNNQSLGAGKFCTGTARNMDTVLGWGDQKSICVSTAGSLWS
jgi:hypothetical protein